MDTSHSNETNANKALSDLIKRVMHGRETQAEHTRILAGKDNAGKAPDIVITAQGRSPVVIEAEYKPAHEVEKDAKARLGYDIKGQIHHIEAAIALRYPDEFAHVDNIDKALEETDQLEYCAVYPKGKRFPTTGWLEGSVSDLADLIHLVDVPKSAFDKCADDLRKSIDGAVSQFQYSRDILTNQIFNLLGLVEVLKTKDLSETKKRKEKKIQTGRVAGAIIANALIFHERIANAYEGILPINQICGHPVYSSKKAALTAWEDILNINYWPIFDTAHKIINILSAGKASSILKTLTNAAERIHEDGLLYEHDLTGHVFQDLIIDRKYLAAFYTLPESAALLARLAVSKMNGIDWSDPQEISRLRIADFACGTGALLSAVYDQIANRHERTGGNPEKLHKSMMEQVLYGFDVLPYATHLTASILSGKQPAETYKETWLCTMPYGRQEDETVKIGSLEFLDKSEQLVLQPTRDPAKAKRIGSKGQETEDLRKVEVPNNSLDLIIMNPPFTRNVTREGAYEGTFAAAFAAFGASDQDQKDMAKRMMLLKQGTCYHASAGMASAFVALADKKLKPGGILALVLPLSTANGSAWQKFRALLAKEYTEVEVVSLADAGCYDVAFSADTSMADCLVIARKKSANIPKASASPTRFISLLQRPANFAASAETAIQLAARKTIRKLEDGPFGGDEVVCGKEKMGETILTTVPKTNPAWNPVRIRDYSLPQTAYKLTESQLWLPGEANPLPLPMVELGAISEMGYYHLQIISGPPNDAPFTRTAPSDTSTYPALWSHNAKRETQLICQPDCQLLVKPGMETQAARIWKSAGHCHLTQDFGLGSQSLSIAFTKRKCIGGRAWPNVNFTKKDWDYAFALWGNSTLGLLLFWWHANRQQPGRAIITISTSKTLPVLDFRALSDAQIKQAKAIFKEFKNKHFLPAYLADEDETREELDQKVLCDWLGFEESIYGAVRQLAHKWCAEPSVHGGKQRNKNTSLAI